MLDRLGFDWSAAGAFDWSVVERDREERMLSEGESVVESGESVVERPVEGGEASVEAWACPMWSDPYGEDPAGEVVRLVREESGLWSCPRCGRVSWSPVDDAAWRVPAEE